MIGACDAPRFPGVDPREAPWSERLHADACRSERAGDVRKALACYQALAFTPPQPGEAHAQRQLEGREGLARLTDLERPDEARALYTQLVRDLGAAIAAATRLPVVLDRCERLLRVAARADPRAVDAAASLALVSHPGASPVTGSLRALLRPQRRSSPSSTRPWHVGSSALRISAAARDTLVVER